MKNMPKISIIMPVYNCDKFLREAINSLLKQTYRNFELILIDDASTDKTLVIINKFKDKRIKKYRNNKNLGVAKSLNLGLSYAKGDYIARMDGDDISKPDRLETQVKYLEKNHDCDLIGSWVELISDNNEFLKLKKTPVGYQVIKRDIIKYNPFIHPSVMMRRSVFNKLGGYDENLNGAEDYDLFLRIVPRYKCVNLPQLLLKYRINKSAVSLSHMKKVELQSLKARIKAFRKYGYPLWQGFYLIKPLIMFLIPAVIKLHFYPVYEK